MSALLPGKPPPKLQALCTALWDGLRITAYISGGAIILLSGPQKLLQTIYVDDVESLEAIAVEESSGAIAVCGGHNIYIYKPIGKAEKFLRWSQKYVLSSPESSNVPSTLSWGSSEELLVGGKILDLWLLSEAESPTKIWTQKLANPVKLALFSPDAALVASIGHYDRILKIWRRQSYESVRFDVSYLPHPAAVTQVHWRKPWHVEQNLENLLYTLCADNKIRIWTHSDSHALSIMELWNVIDMNTSIQPRRLSVGSVSDRRYGFILDSRDFSIATEKAVQNGPGNGSDHALEHLIEIATRSPEICVILDGRGHMSAWGLENAGYKNKKPPSVFNVAHVDGMNISFGSQSNPGDDYVQFCVFAGEGSKSPLVILVHYYDGRINWFDTQITQLFDTAPNTKRVEFKASWSGHDAPVKKIVRSLSGRTAMSRTNDNHAVVWRQKTSITGPILTRQSSIDSTKYIHKSCLIADGKFAVNLHHDGISLWNIQSPQSELVATWEMNVSAKPLCILAIPFEESNIYVATICADMSGLAWEIALPQDEEVKTELNGVHSPIRQFCEFQLELPDPISSVMPVDPAGHTVQVSSFLDTFAADVAMSISANGILNMFTAKVNQKMQKVEWLATSTVDTGIKDPSLASSSSIRKAALVDQLRTGLTIWDTKSGQVEYENQFSTTEVIQDLDWTSTPDEQSILAVGFAHRVVLLSQLRYNYLNQQQPAWCPIQEIQIRDLTAHPIGDSSWLGNGHLIVGAGNQLFVFDRNVKVLDPVLAELRIPVTASQTLDLFQIVRRLNGSLPVFHPQFVGQCVLSGKTELVHKILTTLHQKLKFSTDSNDIDSFLDIPFDYFFTELEPLSKSVLKEMRSSYADFSMEEEDQYVTEDIASTLNENLAKITLTQMSSREQFYLTDIIECVAAVDKHRRSMDDNAARYLLFFRQHMLRKGHAAGKEFSISWREVVWAFHSDSQDILIDLVSRSYHGRMVWENARESGMFMWMSDVSALRAQLEIIARNEYNKRGEKSPIDCSLYYLALRKKSILQGLWRMTYTREQAATLKLLANNFNEVRWKTTARKNAYALLSKRRFEYAAAFFLLGDSLADAVNVCVNQLKDIQLAVTIARAYGGDDSPILQTLISEKVLLDAAETGNRWMASWAFWMLGRRDKAVRTIISPIHSLLDQSPTLSGDVSPVQLVNLQAKSYLSNDPALVVLYKQLREKTVSTLKGASKIHPREEWDFVIQNARLYSRMGCDLLALDLTKNWEFLVAHPSAVVRNKSVVDVNAMDDPRKMLRRRSSLVIDDLPQAVGTLRLLGVEKRDEDPFHSFKLQEGSGKDVKPPPTVFEEPSSSSLLDNFGF